jgi:uncharacterized phage protein (TIGR01671 family)
MQREIKFRVFHKGKMMEVRSIHNLHSQVNLRAELCDPDGGFGTGNPAVTDEITIDNLMQYTGLKDKNGVEIYEGDVLAVRPYGYYKKDGTHDLRVKDEWLGKYVVEWGLWGNEDLQLAGGYEYENEGKAPAFNITVGDDGTIGLLEVIGNIYENPALLKPQASQEGTEG